MNPYDRKKPLISIHIPKCAGTSFRRVLRKWFGANLYLHYIRGRVNQMPHRHSLRENICIHGHFNNVRKAGVLDYYPEVDQFITILREPFAIDLSLYFFQKRLGEKRPLQGKPEPFLEPDVKTYLKGKRSNLLDYMPHRLTLENYEEVLDRYFLYIGIVEDLQRSVNLLAEKLGFRPMEIKHLNVSNHDEEVFEELRSIYIENHPLEYAIYNYALNHYKL